MRTKSNLQDLHATFTSLPPKVKEWVASEEVTLIIGEITYRLGLPEEKVPIIPGLVFRLITNDVEPLHFISELAAELGVNFQTAKTIAEDVEKKILRPIERELRATTGLDVKTIYFGRPEGASVEEKIPTAQPEPAKTAPTLKQILPPTTPPAPQEKPAAPTPPPQKPTGPTVNVTSFESEIISPFMLHKEESFAAPTTGEFAKKSVSLNIKIPESKKPEIKAIPVRLETQEAPRPTTPKPTSPVAPQPAAKPEIREFTTKPQPAAPTIVTPTQSAPTPQPTAPASSSNLPMNLDDSKARVVHYNGYRTPLNPLGKPLVPQENTVDLRSLTNNKRPSTNE
jgi:hypothetical protein